MKNKNTITTLIILIALFSAVASGFGIFSGSGSGAFWYESIRGESIEIFGKGLYRHMSSDVAIQGIAQDYITLFVAIPLLIISLTGYRRGSVRMCFMLGGILGYFLVSYLLYLAMGMYNEMYLIYVVLLGLSFFALFLIIRQLSQLKIPELFSQKTPYKFVGWFLVINALAIALLWLGVIVPPLIDGTIFPKELNHYTTLIVQGFDLGLFLPISFISGYLLIKRKFGGYLYSTIYVIFLSLLMTALTAKIIAMAMHGVNVIPVIFIIPIINMITVICAFLMIMHLSDLSTEKK